MTGPNATDLLERAHTATLSPTRSILAIAGPPGSGKTTLARWLSAALCRLAESPICVAVPMDGFHLANTTLDALGRHEHKGREDTFDGWGFLALMKRILAETEHTVYAPTFERDVDEPIAGSLAIEPTTRLIVVEGNYLLMDHEPWISAQRLYRETWYVETAPETRKKRLLARHTEHGRTQTAAREWIQRVDEKNAHGIAATRTRATLIVPGDNDVSYRTP